MSPGAHAGADRTLSARDVAIGDVVSLRGSGPLCVHRVSLVADQCLIEGVLEVNGTQLSARVPVDEQVELFERRA